MSGDSQKARVDIANADTTSNSELALDLIMSYLPTKDCVRTSLLSSSWRYRWTTTPSLVFDRISSCPPSCRGSIEMESKAVANIINHALILHTGSIQVFKVKGLCIIPDIDCWILRLSKDSIKTLVLDILGEEEYKLHSSLYTCGNLINLRLKNCSLRPPSSFKGFKTLKCLNLKYVSLTDDAFEKLISSCPLLEKLTVNEPEDVDNLKIYAPNLQHVDIIGNFSTIIFGGITSGYAMTRLSVISIDLLGWFRACITMSDFFINLPNIQRLELKGLCLRHFYEYPVPESLPFQFKDLYHLAISIDFSYPAHGLATLCLFRSSPNLTELRIEAWNYEETADGGIWGDRSKCCWEFERLKWVKLDEFCGTRAELEFMKFVLRNSPVLEKMMISPCSDDIKWGDVKSIYGFERASGAEIIFDRRVIQMC